ncbi:MAG: GGDEF domain-containing protein [Romboutsia sp.]|nr:GGDEF domain-containing protein [Romboutsia sp.]
MNFKLRNNKKLNITIIMLCFIFIVFLLVKNKESIHNSLSYYKNIQSLIELSTAEEIKQLPDKEKDKIKLYIDEKISKIDYNKSLLGKSHFILGAIYYSEGNYKLSIDEYNKAIKYFEKVNNKMKLRSYYYLSKSYEYNGQYESANTAFDKLKEDANQKDELELLVDYSIKRDDDIRKNSLNWYRLVVLFEDIAKIAEDIKYDELELIYFRLGNAYWYYEDYINSMKFKLKALNIAESKGRIESVCTIATNIGVYYIYAGQYEEAITYLEQILEYDIEDKNVDLRHKSNALINLAVSYIELGKYEELQSVLDKLYLVIEQIEDEQHKKSLEVTVSTTEADAYIRAGKTDEALKLLKFAENKFNEIEKPTFKNLDKDIIGEYGDLYHSIGEYEKALEYYMEEKKLIEERQLFHVEQISNYRIYLTYKDMGNYSEALKYLERNDELNNNISEERNKKYSKYLIDQLEKNKKIEEIKNLKENKANLRITVAILILFIAFIIIYTINVSRKNKEINRLNELFKDLSATDALTKLRNRRALDEYLVGNWALYKETQMPVTFIMLDIDYFKTYNDNYGHQEGDKALQKVASVIKDCCRNTDFVARYGGEEFTIVMLQTDKHGAISLIERIQKKVYDLNIKHEYSKVSDRVTISFGVSTAYVGTKKDYNDYIKKADEALYISKEKGRNTYTHI